MKKFAIATLLSVCVATPALADNSGKFYVAADLGAASYSNALGTQGASFPNPGVIRIAGGYHFNQQVAIELGYSMFGNSTINYANGSDTLKASSLQMAVIGSLPLNAQFDLTGKLGFANNTVTPTTTVPGFVGINGSKTDLLMGVGAQYHLNSQTSLRIQYESFGKFDSTVQPIKASAISLGVAYNF